MSTPTLNTPNILNNNEKENASVSQKRYELLMKHKML